MPYGHLRAEQILSTQFFLAHETGRDPDILALAVFEANGLFSDRPELYWLSMIRLW